MSSGPAADGTNEKHTSEELNLWPAAGEESTRSSANLHLQCIGQVDIIHIVTLPGSKVESHKTSKIRSSHDW